MKTRMLGVYLGMCLCLASLYAIGAGANFPLLWLFLAVIFGFASAINLGLFDSRAMVMKHAIRLVSYLAVLGCIVAIIFFGGTSEFLSLTLAGTAAGLMLICVLTEPKFEAPRDS